jgi:diguanylate cyclase (GGDEF)-like protein
MYSLARLCLCVLFCMPFAGVSAADAAPSAAVPAATHAHADPWAPFESTWFDGVGVADGLPHSITTSIAQDSKGLIWIGTFGGLVRYDGYRMQAFGQEPGQGATGVLPDAYIRALLPLPDGGLLVGTNAGGLTRFDPATTRFLTYPVGPGGTSDSKIFALAADAHGGYWIATGSGLDRLDLASGRMTHESVRPGDAADMAERTFAVLEDRSGNLWVGTDSGLFVRHAGQSAFSRPDMDNPYVAGILQTQVWALHEDSAGRIWVGTGDSGVVYLDKAGKGHGICGLSGRNGLARRRTIRAFMESQNGHLWIATDGAGLISYDLSTGKLRTAHHDPAVPSSLMGDAARAMLQDRSGNIWVATELGIARYDPSARTVFAVLPSPLQEYTLADPNVHSIFVDPRGRIWLGLGMGRVDVIDLSAGSMTHLRLTGEQAERDVQAFALAPDGSIWAGAQGISRIDPDTFAMRGSVLPSLDGQMILSMQRDASLILIGTYDGVFRFDTATGMMEQFRHDAKDPTSLIGDQVRHIARMGGAWWYATINGISIAGDGVSGFRNLTHIEGDSHSLPQNYTGSIAFDSHNRLWLSTFGGLGYLDHFNPAGPFRFEHIGVAEGLINSKVNALLIDARDRVWTSLAYGMAVIDGKTLKVSDLGARDGQRIPSYIHRSAAIAPGGELLFGGLGGLSVVRPNWVPPVVPPSTLAITYAVVNDVPLPIGKLPCAGGTIALDQHNRSLRVDFALLDYRAPAETRYAYQMSGFDDWWTEVPHGNPPTAIYTNLPSGDYTLRIRASTKGLNAKTLETSVHIVVMPRWYESIPVRIVMVLLGLIALFALMQLRTVYLRRRAALLQREIDARTRDLKAANERLDELAGTDELTGAHNRRRFLELAERARVQAEAAGKPLSLVLIDLDHFKVVNDTYGHLAGDAVIRSTMQVTSALCRPIGLVGRYGGEELILCLPGADSAAAMEVTERIRLALAANVVVHNDRSIQITVSAGVAVHHGSESLQAMLGRADLALYEAKRGGRNRTCQAS